MVDFNAHLITPTDLGDTLANAIDTGMISYWCEWMNVEREGVVETRVYPAHSDLYDDPKTRYGALIHGGALRLRVLEDSVVHEGRREYVFGAKELRRGIERAAQASGKTPRAFLDDGDASDADNAVQMGLFGDVIFG